jgi:hypothetical protein
MQETAPKVKALADRVITNLTALGNEGAGPGTSRYREFMAGKIGSPDPKWTAYRTNAELLATLLTRMHMGARGTEGVVQRFENLISAGKQSPDNMRVAIQNLKDYADDVLATRKNVPSAAGPAPTAAPETTGSTSTLPVMNTPEEARAKLQPGQQFRTPDGQVRTLR